MSDTCWLTVHVRSDQVEMFRKCAGLESYIEEQTPHVMQLTYEEANHALFDEMTTAAIAGCEFYGYYTHGDEYGSCEFFATGLKLTEMHMSHDGSGYVVYGSTPEQRLTGLRELEDLILTHGKLVQCMNNPLYDLVESAE
jgi:hypothetical protein